MRDVVKDGLSLLRKGLKSFGAEKAFLRTPNVTNDYECAIPWISGRSDVGGTRAAHTSWRITPGDVGAIIRGACLSDAAIIPVKLRVFDVSD